MRFNTTRWSENYFNTGLNELEHFLLEGGTINNSSAVMFNKKFLDLANPFDITFKYIGDMYAFTKVLAISDIAYIKDCLNFYRDPFNKKHMDKHIHYFYEQFVLLDWIHRNTPISAKNFFRIFYKNTRNSVYRNWNKTKVKIYRDLSLLNSGLFVRFLFHNLVAPFKVWKK
jgi:hypothetical protein